MWTDEIKSNAAIPTETWFDVRIHMEAGDASTGRVQVDLALPDGTQERVADVQGATVYPGGPIQTFTNLHTLKLYTSGRVICWLNDRSMPLDLLWDDFQIGTPHDK